MGRSVRLVTLAAALALGALAGATLAPGEPPPRTPAPRPAAVGPVAPDAPDEPVARVAPDAAPPAAAPAAPDLAAALDGFLGALPVAAPSAGVAPDALLARGIAEGQDPVATRLALEASLRRDPAGRVALVDALADLPPGATPWALPVALALAAHLDAPATTRLLARLEAAPARNRPHLVVALRGSSEPRADAAFAALYADGDPAVRDAAALVLGERAERLAPDVRHEPLARARRALAADDPGGWSAAADVLGAPPLAAGDRALLIDVLAHDRDPRRRLLALRALAGASVPLSEVRPVLEAVASDPLADETLRAAARAVSRG